MPEVSVIVPVYKVEPWLRQCLDSVVAQTFTNFELILVDDGSPDSCGAICDEYAARDSRIRVVHQENAGQGKARNVGMDQAVGKYIIFLDSDDYWLPTTLETLYTEAERNQTQVLVFAGQPFWDGMEKPETYSSLQLTVQNGVVKPGPVSLKTALDAGEYYTSPVRRFYLWSYLRLTGLRFDGGNLHEDVTFSFLAYLLAERVECIGNRLYQRRYRPGSALAGKSLQSSVHGYCVALNSLMDAYNNLTLSPLGKEQLERFIVGRVLSICSLYGAAIRQKQAAWRTARWIQKDARQTLKRARALPNLPRSLRLATYSLFLGWFVPKAERKLKRYVGQALRKLFPYRMALRDHKKSLEQIQPNVQLTREQWIEKIKKQYKENIGHELNLEQPQRYTEKIQWRKLYDNNPLYSVLADKYAVREWVKEKIGEEHLIPLLGVWDRAEDIDFDQLPDSFVLKTNNACKTNIIVRNKKNINKKLVIEQMNYWLAFPFWAKSGQFHYKDIPPKIIAEQFMQSEGTDGLTDYKFFCFNGKPYCCGVYVDRYHGQKRNIYDLDWKPLCWMFNRYERCSIEKPAQFEKMIALVETLCKGFSHVRVDLYLIQQEINFGEMTFTTGSGYDPIFPDEYDYIIGEQWTIDRNQVMQRSTSKQ